MRYILKWWQTNIFIVLLLANMGNRGCRICTDIETAASSSCVKHYLHFAKPLYHFNRNVFHIAAERGHLNIIVLLAKTKFVKDINGSDLSNKTPLIISMKDGNFECSQALLKYGADICIPDILGNSAIDYAFQNKISGKYMFNYLFEYSSYE